MKVTIKQVPKEIPEEITISCHALDESIVRIIKRLSEESELVGYLNGAIYRINPDDIYYLETTEGKTFAYLKEKVYEIRLSLNAAGENLSGNFFRCSKSMIVNLDKMIKVKPDFSGRMVAFLGNGEKVLISRQYVKGLKDRMGI